MDFFSPFGDTKPFGGFGSHMSGAARGKYILEYFWQISWSIVDNYLEISLQACRHT